jgi:phage tail-like protein
MEHKVIKEGGRNYGTAMRAGQVTFGTVILKRGIVKSQSLWRWWSAFAGGDPSVAAKPAKDNRCDVLIGLIDPVGADKLKSSDGDPDRKVAVAWRLVNAMPVKFRINDLNAKGSDVAVEELHFVHEGLQLEPGS